MESQISKVPNVEMEFADYFSGEKCLTAHSRRLCTTYANYYENKLRGTRGKRIPIKEFENVSLKLMPNPNAGVFKVSNAFDAQNITLKIIGTDGNELYNSVINPNENISIDLASGIYFYQFLKNNKWTKVEKLVILK